MHNNNIFRHNYLQNKDVGSETESDDSDLPEVNLATSVSVRDGYYCDYSYGSC